MKQGQYWIAIGVCAFGLSAIAGIEPQAFEIARSTIDSGGVMRSVGGDFEMSSTIGQPDAGKMSGGDFELAGGFWFALPPTDCNDDGIVSLLDHETFTACLSGPDGGIDASPCPCFDVDGDGDITLSDYAILQRGFTRP